MAPRQHRRDQWRQTKNGTWTLSLGYRGVRVRLFQKAKGGGFYRDVHRPDGTRDRKTLATCDRREAEQRGRQLLAALLGAPALVGPETAHAPCRVSLGALCDRFVDECAMFLDNDPKGQKEARVRLDILRSAIGDARAVHTLTRHDVQQYEARRKKGGIQYGDGQVTPAVGQRSVQADVKLLKQVLGWGCTVCGVDGTPLLERHPLERIGVKGEHDPRRPTTSFDRFEKTRAAMQAMQQRYADEVKTTETRGERSRAEARRCTWIRAELGLVLLEATGRRRGSIMRLRWEDVDFQTGRITWRREHDKKRKEWVVAYPESLLTTIREMQRRLGVVGGPVFPRRKEPQRSAPPELLSEWILKAETSAGLPKLEGGTCHPFRRKWKSERAHHPVKAVAVAGGWTDIATMLRCYDHPDDADVLAVTSESFKRRELSIDARSEASG
jgi:integrase